MIKLAKSKSTEKFQKEVYELVGNEYVFLEPYKKTNIPIKVRHNSEICGYHEYLVAPNHFLNDNSRCPKCTKKLVAKNKIKKNEDFLKEVENIVGNEYTVLDKYINAKTKIKFRHNNDKCNNFEFYMSPNNFLKGNRCSKCFGTVKKTTEQFKQEVFRLVKDEYSILEEYKNAHTKILIRHNCIDCSDHEWEITPAKFINGNRCPICYGTPIKTDIEFIKEVYRLVGNEYLVIGKYKNAKTSILIQHNCQECNNYQWYIRPTNFLSGRRCPKCSESKGEQAIRHWLGNNKITFQSQFIFNSLLSDLGNPLRFDFAIFKDEEKTQLKYLIEYDGEQHFKWIKGWQSKKDFEILQIHDKRKNEYCIKNNIQLIRIPYWDFDNISEILNKLILYDNK